MISIVDALDDERLLGAAFPDASSWAAWRVFLRAVFGVAMTETERAIYTTHTGRETPPRTPARASRGVPFSPPTSRAALRSRSR